MCSSLQSCLQSGQSVSCPGVKYWNYSYIQVNYRLYFWKSLSVHFAKGWSTQPIKIENHPVLLQNYTFAKHFKILKNPTNLSKPRNYGLEEFPEILFCLPVYLSDLRLYKVHLRTREFLSLFVNIKWIRRFQVCQNLDIFGFSKWVPHFVYQNLPKKALSLKLDIFLKNLKLIVENKENLYVVPMFIKAPCMICLISTG